MAVTGQKDWTLIIFLGYQCVSVTSSELCTYKTPTGHYATATCPQICCSRREALPFDKDICCSYSYGSGMYVGAGLGVLVVIATAALCCIYFCCRQRILRLARENRNTTARSVGTRRTGTQNEPLPSVSVRVEPVLPPPYDETQPPPYTLMDTGSSLKLEAKLYPNEPPPGYTADDVPGYTASDVPGYTASDTEVQQRQLPFSARPFVYIRDA